MGFNVERFAEVMGTILLFCLVFGMSATVDIECLKAQLKNVKALATGLFLQFIIMPFLGFLVTSLFNLDHASGLVLLVVTTSPGGSYSNWFCSLFNGDLALSVAMTAISTIASIVMLPLNLYFYAVLAYNDDVREALEWSSIMLALAIVIVGIVCGLLASAQFRTTDFHLLANRIGNVGGILLVVCSAVISNSNSETRLYNREWSFYIGVALPCVTGLLIATIITSALNLLPPERVAVAVECCVQNLGIATSVALTIFQGEQMVRAVAVPFYYGLVECVSVAIYCVIAWKSGWTKAPADVSVWTMISTSYEVLNVEDKDESTEKVVDDFYYVDAKDATTPSVDVTDMEMNNNTHKVTKITI